MGDVVFWIIVGIAVVFVEDELLVVGILEVVGVVGVVVLAMVVIVVIV